MKSKVHPLKDAPYYLYIYEYVVKSTCVKASMPLVKVLKL